MLRIAWQYSTVMWLLSCMSWQGDIRLMHGSDFDVVVAPGEPPVDCS